MVWDDIIFGFQSWIFSNYDSKSSTVFEYDILHHKQESKYLLAQQTSIKKNWVLLNSLISA